MSWNTMTRRGAKWFEKCGAKALRNSTIESFQLYIELYEQNPTEEAMLESDIYNGRTNPHAYSGLFRYVYM
jgi:hypothetical protein